MQKITSVGEISTEQFNTLYFNRQPVVHKGSITHTNNYRLWSLDYLKSKIGLRLVEVNFSKTGVYNFTVEGQIQKIKGTFNEMAKFFTSETQDSKSYYLQQYSISEHFPELLGDLANPEWNFSTDVTSYINIWVGGAGCLTPLHYDGIQNFLVQIRGRKEIILFSPEDSGYLYPNTSNLRYAHMSEIELDKVDLSRFPLYEKAKPFYCLLEEGDVLYIPSGWWHHVRSLDMSISVNYWWNRLDVVEGAIGMESLSVDQLRSSIKLFLDKGLKIDHADEKGEILLLKAIRFGYLNLVEAFLSLGANPNSRSHHYKPGRPALNLAMDTGNARMVELLKAYGATDTNIA